MGKVLPYEVMAWDFGRVPRRITPTNVRLATPDEVGSPLTGVALRNEAKHWDFNLP
jgi:hypothetical protein